MRRKPYTVVPADDHQDTKEFIKYIFKENFKDKFMIVGDASTGFQAVRLAEQYKPDFLITDIMLPEKDGIRVIKEVREQNPKVVIVAVSAYDDARTVLQVIKAGANGYVFKTQLGRDFGNELIQIAANRDLKKPTPKELIFKIIQSTSIPGMTLSRQQIEVLYWAANGLTQKKIATKIKIKAGTVKGYLSEAFQILHAKNITHAVALAIKFHYIPVDQIDEGEPKE